MAVGIAVFLLLALSVSVSAAEVVASGYCGGEGDGKNLTWTLDSDGVLTISGSGAMGNGDNYGSQPWTKYQDNIKKAVVSEGVTTLGEDALINCSHLTDVMLPESLTEIGDYAFFCCENLKELTIPRSVTKIGHRVNANVFTHCDSLVRIDADSLNPVFSSEDGVLFNKDKTELFCFPPGRTGRYTIPEGVTRIGKEAFSLRCKLTRVTIPDGVTSIGAYAFWGCCLTAIKLPDSVTSIGDAAFDQCGFLSNIAIPVV